MPRMGATHPYRLNAALRREKAIALRLEGRNYHEIGRELGVSHKTAWGDVHFCLDRAVKSQLSTGEEVRQLILRRLDELLLGLWPKRKNPRYADSILRIEDTRAKLLGLYEQEELRGDAIARGVAVVWEVVPVGGLTVETSASAGGNGDSRLH